MRPSGGLAGRRTVYFFFFVLFLQKGRLGCSPNHPQCFPDFIKQDVPNIHFKLGFFVPNLCIVCVCDCVCVAYITSKRDCSIISSLCLVLEGAFVSLNYTSMRSPLHLPTLSNTTLLSHMLIMAQAPCTLTVITLLRYVSLIDRSFHLINQSTAWFSSITIPSAAYQSVAQTQWLTFGSPCCCSEPLGGDPVCFLCALILCHVSGLGREQAAGE